MTTIAYTDNEMSDFYKEAYKERGRAVRKGYDYIHDAAHGPGHLVTEALNRLEKGEISQAAGILLSVLNLLAYQQGREQSLGEKNSMQRDVEEFMRRCDQEVKSYPALPSDEVRDLRIKLMTEELLGKKGEDGNGSDELVESMLKGDLNGIADGLCDVLYVVFGTAAAYGINIQEIFDEVQRSNLTKAVLNDDGEYKVIKNEFGKILKPETFSPANLGPILEKQLLSGPLVRRSGVAIKDVQYKHPVIPEGELGDVAPNGL